MNEEQTKHDKITPALKEAGWDAAPFKIALEQQVAPRRPAPARPGAEDGAVTIGVKKEKCVKTLFFIS